LGDLFLENYKSKGLPYHPDMFSTGETANGCGHALRTTWKGNRTTGADYITKAQKKSNITLRCHSNVDKVLFERGSDGAARAHGVEYLDDSGRRHQVFASKEVILTAGSYGSPAILLRSGIGAKDDLQALGIPVVVDAPGVGKNLQDHQLIFIYYELNQAGLTDDARVNHDPNAFENGAKEWKEKKSGWLAQFPFGSFAFARLADRLEAENEEWRSFRREPGRDPMELTETQPNLEFFHTICYGGPPE
jgi:choline dehydrogenase-like flavoprotein